MTFTKQLWNFASRSFLRIIGKAAEENGGKPYSALSIADGLSLWRLMDASSEPEFSTYKNWQNSLRPSQSIKEANTEIDSSDTCTAADSTSETLIMTRKAVSRDSKAYYIGSFTAFHLINIIAIGIACVVGAGWTMGNLILGVASLLLAVGTAIIESAMGAYSVHLKELIPFGERKLIENSNPSANAEEDNLLLISSVDLSAKVRIGSEDDYTTSSSSNINPIKNGSISSISDDDQSSVLSQQRQLIIYTAPAPFFEILTETSSSSLRRRVSSVPE